MKSGKKLYFLLGLFIALTVTSILILNFYPSNISRTMHQTSTPTGEIFFNLYQPIGLTQPTPVVVIGHGIIVNKEFMNDFAVELATNGFIVANLDWSGHGQSTSPLGNLTVDLEAVIEAIPTLQPLADMSALALLGYSMGGFPTYPYAATHATVKAWVGVDTNATGAISNTTNPRNVLIIVGSLDEVFSPEDAKIAMVSLTGASDVSEIDLDTLYGSIENGTAREVHVIPGADHLVSPWTRDSIETATAWIMASFGMTVPPLNTVLPFDVRAAFAWIGFLALVGLIFVLAAILVDPFHLRKESNNTVDEAINPKVFENHSMISFLGKYYLFTFLLLPTILIFIPLVIITPIAFTALMAAVNGCFGVNVLFYSWRLAKRWNISIKGILKKNLLQGKNIWLYSIILTAVFFFCYYPTIGLNYLGMIPATPRIPYLILYCALLFFIILFSTTFVQKFSTPYLEAKFKIQNPTLNYLAISSVNFLLVDSWFVILIMTICILMENYFIAMILILMIPIFLLINFFGVYIEKLTGSVIPTALFHAILLGFIITTLSPYGGLSSLPFLFR
jgi:dienelactone hydrolase